jgi:ABC-type uncharacterized transport system ATPase subunit
LPTAPKTTLENVALESLDELTLQASFDRADYSTGEVIRDVVAHVEVRDIVIEEESIEDIVRRIYTGGATAELAHSRAGATPT